MSTSDYYKLEVRSVTMLFPSLNAARFIPLAFFSILLRYSLMLLLTVNMSVVFSSGLRLTEAELVLEGSEGEKTNEKNKWIIQRILIG